jgi:protein TonB
MVSSGWRNALAAWLERHRHYPEAARERSEEGTAVIRFTIRRDGQVVSVALVRSSGSAILDAAAQAMLSGGHLPAFSADMPQEETTVTVPIRYRLDQ